MEQERRWKVITNLGKSPTAKIGGEHEGRWLHHVEVIGPDPLPNEPLMLESEHNAAERALREVNAHIGLEASNSTEAEIRRVVDTYFEHHG